MASRTAKLALFVVLGSEEASYGAASLTAVTMGSIAQSNLAMYRPVTTSKPSDKAAGGNTIESGVLTNLQLAPLEGETCATTAVAVAVPSHRLTKRNATQQY